MVKTNDLLKEIITELKELNDQIKKQNEDLFPDLYREMREIKVRLMEVIK